MGDGEVSKKLRKLVEARDWQQFHTFRSWFDYTASHRHFVLSLIETLCPWKPFSNAPV
jgi:hypothetical protein